MVFFLIKIALPVFLIFAACDTPLGSRSSGSESVLDQELEANEFGGADNPFLGKDWMNDEGFIYTFGCDGTIFVEHHCGLEFDNQFSYLIWKNILVIYGTEMDNTDTLKAGTMRADGDSIVFTTTANETITYTLVTNGPAPEGSDPMLDNLFIGTWLAGNVRYEFAANGILVQSAAGQSAEYSYLVRKGRLVTLSHETFPRLREYRFEKNGNNITVDPVGGGNPLIYTPMDKKGDLT
jgi:hypothetical protein